MVGVTGDITELQARGPLAAAKEAADAHRDVEITREIMQTVLDNMSDGVMLFDKNLRWQFCNRQLMEFMGFTPEVALCRRAGGDILRFQAERGDFGRSTTRRAVDERADDLRGGRQRYERRTASGRYIEFTFKPLERRRPARHLSRHHRPEGARGSARRRQRVGRNRARRGRGLARRRRCSAQRYRAHAREHADGPRQHDRRRHAVRQGPALEFANEPLMEFQRFRRTSSIRAPRRRHPAFQAERGDFGAVAEGYRGRDRTPDGPSCETARATNAAPQAAFIEFTFNPLDDGSLLRVHRDITELKEREEALAAKEARRAARRREGTRQMMQTVLDNMGDGVMLFDKDFKVQFINQRHRNSSGSRRRSRTRAPPATR